MEVLRENTDYMGGTGKTAESLDDYIGINRIEYKLIIYMYK